MFSSERISTLAPYPMPLEMSLNTQLEVLKGIAESRVDPVWLEPAEAAVRAVEAAATLAIAEADADLAEKEARWWAGATVEFEEHEARAGPSRNAEFPSELASASAAPSRAALRGSTCSGLFSAETLISVVKRQGVFISDFDCAPCR